jgi:hypothetical protein
MAAYTPAFERLRAEVLNRVIPGLRHNMLGKLQPIALLSQVLSKKLAVGNVEQAYIHNQVDEIKLNSKLLTTATQNLFSWMAMDVHTHLPADEIVTECVELLKMESYRNHLIISNHVSSKTLLPALETRILVCAGIIVLADKEGSEKILEIRSVDDHIQLLWNEACTGAPSKNSGLLNNWDWIRDISPVLDIKRLDQGIAFNFHLDG